MTRDHVVKSIAFLWAALFALSFVVAFSLDATGDGFTRGLNRVTAFFFWQGIAFVVAIVALLLGPGSTAEKPHSRWWSRLPAIVHASLILLAVGLVLILNYTSRPVDTSLPPRPVTAPAPVVASPAETTPAPAPVVASPSETATAIEPSVATVTATESAATVRQFSGVFRGGFEASHFYTMDGQGPWWLEASDADWERINASFVNGPGRSGSVTVALIANGWLEETDGELEYLGIDEYRFHVSSIDSLRVLSEQEFDLVMDTITQR